MSGSRVEVVFVSSDKSEEDMLSYMTESHGDWPAVEHKSAVSDSLKEKYEVRGIPTLVVVKKDGTLITKDGRSHIISLGPDKALKEWRRSIYREDCSPTAHWASTWT